MVKKNGSFILFAVIVISLLVFLSTRGRKAPILPGDDLHRYAITNTSCRGCHGPGAPAPLKEGHPPKEQCLTCHTHGG